MELLKCKCCGSNSLKKKDSTTYICEYCGAQYKQDNEQHMIRIETYQNPCHVLKSKFEIPQEAMHAIGARDTAKLASERLARNLADALAPYMEMNTEYDPATMTQVVTASVRIIEPKYRF